MYYDRINGEKEVDITLTNPVERVVFYKELDFNPFEMLFNGLEMIAKLKPSKLKKALKFGRTIVFESHNCVAEVHISYGLQMIVYTDSLDLLSEEHTKLAIGLMMIQEYIAKLIDEDIGSYTHVSKQLSGKPGTLKELRCPYMTPGIYPRTLVNNRSKFFKETKAFNSGDTGEFKNTFLTEVAVPMRAAYELYKEDQPEKAMVYVAVEVWSADWKLAATEWLHRRILEGRDNG